MLRTSSSRRSLASAGRRAIAGATDPQYGLSACTDNETHLDAIVDAVRDVSGVEVVHVCARGRSPVVRRVANQEWRYVDPRKSSRHVASSSGFSSATWWPQSIAAVRTSVAHACQISLMSVR